MTTAALPRARRSLLGKLAAAAGDGRLAKLGKLAATVAREHLPTVAAFSAIDYGAFTGSPVAGWIVTGVTLLLLDFKVRD